MEKKEITKKREKKVIVEIPDLIDTEFYWFIFNEKCPEKDLHNVRHLLTGEMVKIFIKQDYGILHK